MTGGGSANEERTRIFSLLVANKPGVLFRITSLFRRKNFNIESVSVGEHIREDESRIVISLRADDPMANVFERLLRKQIDVYEVRQMDPTRAALKELALVRVRLNEGNGLAYLHELCSIFDYRVISINRNYAMVQAVDAPSRLEEFLAILGESRVKDIARTGVTALEEAD